MTNGEDMPTMWGPPNGKGNSIPLSMTALPTMPKVIVAATPSPANSAQSSPSLVSNTPVANTHTTPDEEPEMELTQEIPAALDTDIYMEEAPTPLPTTVIHQSPGPFSTPNDNQQMYNAYTLPNDFDYKTLGIFSTHLRFNVSERAQQAWKNATDYTVIIVPLFMAYSLPCMQKAKVDATIFIKRAFPTSAATFSVIPAAKVNDQQGDKPLPWSIMIAGLRYRDAATLLYYQFWLSKAFSFAAHPASDFTSTWLGNWVFAAGEDEEAAVTECLKQNMALTNTAIGQHLINETLNTTHRCEIIDSAEARPITTIRRGTPSTHWVFTAISPHPSDANKHRQWVTVAKNTEWYHPAIATANNATPRIPANAARGGTTRLTNAL
ncbi:uncharacterized protein EI90DRAFT_3020039 [Cantharellus anzutake]|uniref:uncharacterized protein n=1 Tax=Cantharellus anzutake TaxID=1750568 RepID=UPI0019088E56|nr:uncharacterized protein EI90DRAFT_3020039 [Cantharellus anzutake]KAF8322773.1 hypothetical protein EI90DRAFT_3020039 [Cantharellus anzutake]